MNRRAFVTGLGAVLAAPLAAEAQQAGKVYRVGFLSNGWSTTSAQVVAAFRQGLRELAWVEGQNIVIEYRWAEGKSDRLADLAAELVRVRVDVLVASGAAATRAAKEATTAIPSCLWQYKTRLRSGRCRASAGRAGTSRGRLSLAASR
jgi:ABC-type uncharacterized transport system substrate-binding protein